MIVRELKSESIKKYFDSKQTLFKKSVRHFFILHWYELMILSSISLFYVLLIAYWTQSKLLFGGDGVGYYNYYNFTQRPNPSSLIWAISEIASFENIYLMYYIHLFIGTFFSVVGIFLLTRLVLNCVTGKKSQIAGILSSLLYLFNPWSVSLTYISITNDVSIGFGGFTFFLVGLFIFLNNDISNKIKRYSPIISGMGLGLAQSPFPNYIRILVVVMVIFAVIMVIQLLREKTRNLHSLGAFSFFAAISVIISIMISLEYFTPIFSSIHSTISLASSGAANKIYLGFYSGHFNNIFNEIRGLSGWQYPHIFYYNMYQGLAALSVISYLWPIFALVLPIFFLLLRNRKNSSRFFILIFALLIVIFWDKGENPPFGQLWIFINSFLPTGYQFIPTSYLTTLFISRFYPIFIAFSLVETYKFLTSLQKEIAIKNPNISLKLKPKILIKKYAPSISVFILTILLLYSSYPMFIGYA